MGENDEEQCIDAIDTLPHGWLRKTANRPVLAACARTQALCDSRAVGPNIGAGQNGLCRHVWVPSRLARIRAVSRNLWANKMQLAQARYSLSPIGRVPEFDGIRGMSSLVVLFGHLAVAHSAEHLFAWFLGSMEVFFCLSAFLITYVFVHKYRQGSGFNIRAYLTNRVLRIWPAYYFTYGLAVVLAWTVGRWYFYGNWHALTKPTLFAWLTPLFFAQNLEMLFGRDRAPYLELFNHSWSLAMEEQFYLFLPAVVIALRKRTASFALAIILCAGLFSVIQRALGQDVWLITSRLDPFILGAFLCVAYNKLRTYPVAVHRIAARATVTLLVLSIVLLIPAIVSTYIDLPLTSLVGPVLAHSVCDPIFGFSMFATGLLGFILFGHQQSVVHRLCRSRSLRGFGEISYSTYLLHPLIIFSLAPLLPLPEPAIIFVSGPLTIVMAYFNYRFIEQPFMRLRQNS